MGPDASSQPDDALRPLNEMADEDLVALLVAAGATVDSAWPADPRRRSLLIEKMGADPRMIAALKGEMPAQ